jgi:sugar (pentulose or hexulose) kinase
MASGLCTNGFRPSPIFEPVSAQPPSLGNHRAPGERAAALAASWCTRRLGGAYAQPAWQMLADAARLGVIRHGRPEAWAAGAVVALARASGLLGAGRALTAQQVADEFEVTLSTLTVTERELARALNIARYAPRSPAT